MPAKMSSLLTLRLDILSRILPLTDIADRCKIDKFWLVVQGQLGTYRVELYWGVALRLAESGSSPISRIPQKTPGRCESRLFLPFPH